MLKSCNRDYFYFTRPFSGQQQQNLFTSEIVPLFLQYIDDYQQALIVNDFYPKRFERIRNKYFMKKIII